MLFKFHWEFSSFFLIDFYFNLIIVLEHTWSDFEIDCD